MKRYLYLSMLPEALIASMLPPNQFGSYLAIGTKKRTRGQAMFFEVDSTFESDYFSLHNIEKFCQSHEDGTPKRTKYFSVYRVLEHVPLNKLKSLYLTTDDGRVLELKQSEYRIRQDNKLRLYQQLSPVNTRIASTLKPEKFVKYITDPVNRISVPKIVFVQLGLNELALDPVNGLDYNLPFPNIQHLRDCLVELKLSSDKPTKTVIRFMQGDLLYRTIKNGFFVGDQEHFLFYQFPSIEELENEYYTWWRSAMILGFH